MTKSSCLSAGYSVAPVKTDKQGRGKVNAALSIDREMFCQEDVALAAVYARKKYAPAVG